MNCYLICFENFIVFSFYKVLPHFLPLEVWQPLSPNVSSEFSFCTLQLTVGMCIAQDLRMCNVDCGGTFNNINVNAIWHQFLFIDGGTPPHTVLAQPSGAIKGSVSRLRTLQLVDWRS